MRTLMVQLVRLVANRFRAVVDCVFVGFSQHPGILLGSSAFLGRKKGEELDDIHILSSGRRRLLLLLTGDRLGKYDALQVSGTLPPSCLTEMRISEAFESANRLAVTTPVVHHTLMIAILCDKGVPVKRSSYAIAMFARISCRVAKLCEFV